MEGKHVRFLFKPYSSPLKLNCLPVRQKSFAATRRIGRLNVVNFIQRSGITSTTESFAKHEHQTPLHPCGVHAIPRIFVVDVILDRCIKFTKFSLTSLVWGSKNCLALY